MPEKVELFSGGSYTDGRGSLSFVNDFAFENVKRFYQIHHTDASVVRAWQGHKVEHKFFFASTGSFLVALVEIDNWDNPSNNLKPQIFTLNIDNPAILSVPPGYANGIKALTAGSLLTIYSNLTLKESENDRWSFASSLWLNWSAI